MRVIGALGSHRFKSSEGGGAKLFTLSNARLMEIDEWYLLFLRNDRSRSGIIGEARLDQTVRLPTSAC